MYFIMINVHMYCFNNYFICIFISLLCILYFYDDECCKMNFPVRHNKVVLYCIQVHVSLSVETKTLICVCFRKHNIEFKTVKRFDCDTDLIKWADAIFTAGGDGMFLMASSKVKGHDLPVIGINTDPIRYFIILIALMYMCWCLVIICCYDDRWNRGGVRNRSQACTTYGLQNTCLSSN